MSKVLTINPGSTAVKYVLFDNGQEVARKNFDRKESVFSHEEEEFIHSSNSDVIAIRVVHGGELPSPIELKESQIETIRKMQEFAPIHNKYALEIIEFIKDTLPDTKLIAVFDTSFHFSMPRKRRLYPIPIEYADKGLKRYGFHGLALEYIVFELPKVAQSLGVQQPKNYIVAHLGGGASVTAIEGGKSVYTTMGLTPLEGLMMITRSGSVDPSLPIFLAKQMGLSIDQAIDELNNKSGFYGLTGTKDTYYILEKAQENTQPFKLATDMFIDSVARHIMAAAATLDSVDGIVFSGGIGWGNSYVRAKVLDQLKNLKFNKQNTFVIEVKEEYVLLKYAKKYV